VADRMSIGEIAAAGHEATMLMVRDAERYRWLRAGNYPIAFARSVLNDTPHGIDAAIDAMRASSTRQAPVKQADCKCPQGMYCRHRARIEGNSEGTGTNGGTPEGSRNG
jgi:hypothetical protein